ncbi:MAG: glycoside hydrolase family 5 protein [Prevotella sp.]|nr:glycoside hydrolase family 5 protein [Prevotella sp.]
MKKILLTITLLLTQLTVLTAQTGLDKSATQIASEMMPGWNLGNTMEATVNWGSNPAGLFNNNGGLASETAWQGTKTTQAIIDYVKSCGFRSVRIPCAWAYGHISDASSYTIDATWMARVKEIVDYCVNDGLYVLLNDHWDGGWLENNINATGDAKVKNKEVLHALWTQIANEFIDYDEHVVFAGLNEPGVEQQSQVANLVEYEQVFIDAVRATGGNNAKRLLVVQGPSTDTEKTCNWMTPAKMATDPIGGKLAVEVHIYYPWNFWGMTQDESWGNMFYYWGSGNHVSGSTHNATYGEENDLKNLIERLKTTFVDQGIPVFNGEYGIIWRNITGNGESQEKHNASIKTYYKTMNQLCMERGIVPFAWDTNSTGNNSMTIINRSTLTIYNSYMMDGIHEAMEAVGITGLEQMNNNASNDALSLATTDGYYDLSGRPIPSPTRGIYIRNSRKVVVK